MPRLVVLSNFFLLPRRQTVAVTSLCQLPSMDMGTSGGLGITEINKENPTKNTNTICHNPHFVVSENVPSQVL